MTVALYMWKEMCTFPSFEDLKEQKKQIALHGFKYQIFYRKGAKSSFWKTVVIVLLKNAAVISGDPAG